MRQPKKVYRGSARVKVVYESAWHAVTVVDGSGDMFGYEVASYRDRKLARAHAKGLRAAMKPLPGPR